MTLRQRYESCLPTISNYLKRKACTRVRVRGKEAREGGKVGRWFRSSGTPLISRYLSSVSSPCNLDKDNDAPYNNYFYSVQTYLLPDWLFWLIFSYMHC